MGSFDVGPAFQPVISSGGTGFPACRKTDWKVGPTVQEGHASNEPLGRGRREDLAIECSIAAP